MLNSYQFVDLPVELIHMILIYLWGQDIFYSLFGINPYFDSIIKNYHQFHLNLKSIRKSQFDLICRHIRPEQILTLILSDDIDTPCQSKLFSSLFNVERDFSHLRSFVLVSSDWKSTCTELMRHPSVMLYDVPLQKNYIKHSSNNAFNQFRQYPNYKFDDNGNSLSNRRYLEIYLRARPFEEIKKTFAQYPKLTQLNVKLHSIVNEKLIKFEEQHRYLTRFTIRVKNVKQGREMSRIQLEELLASMPRLNRLELEIPVSIDLIDGNQWEMFLTRHLTNLINFDFKFHLKEENKNNISINTFRSSFWLNEKHWMVVFDPIDFSVNTLPRFGRKHMNFPNNSNRLIDDEQFPSFDSYVTCLHLSGMSDEQSFSKYQYMYLRQITLGLDINNDWIERVKSIIIFDQIEELNIGRNQLIEILTQIKPFMSRLQRLVVSCHSLNTLTKNNTKYFRFESIRSLLFYDKECTVNKSENLCYLFPNLEYLQIYLKYRLDMLPYLERLKYLCSVAFEIKKALSDQRNRKRPTENVTREWFVKNVPRWRVNNNFTCQITKAHVYLWINNEH